MLGRLQGWLNRNAWLPWVLLSAAFLFCGGEARAGVYYHATEGAAIAACLNDTSVIGSGYCYGPGSGSGSYVGKYDFCRGTTSPTYKGKLFPSFQVNCSSGNNTHYFSAFCASGEVDYAGGQCVPPGPTPEECAARSPITNVWSPSSTMCDGGCAFSGGSSVLGIEFPGDPVVRWPSSSWSPTGEVCTTGDNAQPIVDDAVCAPVAGLTMCLKTNGQHCATASTGRRICWNPGETGTKTDGAVAQVRAPGATPGPAPTPPAGETLTQTGGPSTTTAKVSTGGTVQNITTTTTNYTTFNGTNAGPVNGGESDDGSGGGSVSGGADCASPPVVAGGDPILGAMLYEQWRARCGDGGQGDVISSAVTDADGLLAGDGDDPAAHEALQGQASEVFLEETLIPSELFGDVNGFLPDASCPLVPDVPVGDAVATFDLTPLCDIFIHLGNLLLVLSYLKGARLYVGSK